MKTLQFISLLKPANASDWSGVYKIMTDASQSWLKILQKRLKIQSPIPSKLSQNYTDSAGFMM